MAIAKTLLERLEFPESRDRPSFGVRTSDIVASVGRHLQQMLNSCHGGAETASDFGISNIAEFFHGDMSVKTIQQEILTSISKYEPRLHDVQVTFVPASESPFELRFDIAGRVVGLDGEAPAVFRSVLNASGQIQVKRG